MYTSALKDWYTHRCQVCGKLICGKDGVTTLNGWFVCDNDSCRTLDEENQAIEILVTE